jgi:stearoyl-CoA desaturase (Delta-9 desaturase)
MTQIATRPDTAPAVVQGVTELDDRETRFQRRMVLIVTVLPFAGFVAAVASLWGTGLTLLDAALFFSFYCFSGLGVTVGYHRLLTHGSFDGPTWIRAAFAISGSMALQGSVISWVAAHRRHHAYSDREGDPHSPHLDEGEGLGGVLRGLWHAHMGWLFSPETTSLERWAPDLMKDPVIRRIDSLFPLWSFLTLALPAAIGFAVTGSPWGAVTAFLWGSLARITFLHHVTWSVNSVCHFYGKRPFASRDFSTNNWLLALVSFGESWHNNHHAFPTAARHGILKGQFDSSALVIRGLQRLGLARDVKMPNEKQLAAKRM